MRLITDMVTYTVDKVPKWNPINICSYHLQEAGATTHPRACLRPMVTAIGVLDAVKASGRIKEEDFGRVVGRISFFVNAGIRFVEEMCKMRAFVELWDRITKERYGVEDPKNRRFRYGVQSELAWPHRATTPKTTSSASFSKCWPLRSVKTRAPRAIQLPSLERSTRPSPTLGSAMVIASDADPRL